METEKGEVIIDDCLKEKDRRFIRSDLTDAELELLLPRGERPEDVLKKFEKYKKIRFTNSKIIFGKSYTPHLIINTNHDEMLQILRWWDKTKRGCYTLEWVYKVQEIKSGYSWTTIIKVEAK